MSEQNTLRDALLENFDAAESGTLGEVKDAPVIEESVIETTGDRQRDDAGKFVGKSAEPAQAAPTDVLPSAEVVTQPQRPTTWKKEYLPIYDKLVGGLPLTPEESRKLADYSGQREKEYATGVATYRAEAQHSKELQEAIQPFIPGLQELGLTPSTWIKEAGQAHQQLKNGTAEQKLQAFARLAQNFNVPLHAIYQQQQGNVDPMSMQLMQQIQQLSGQVNTVTNWRAQQEQQEIQQQIAKFQDASKYPHFEQVRGGMAQLLESGLAQDLEAAYAKAVRMDDNVWTAEQERQANANVATQTQAKAAAAAKAKAQAISPRSVSPNGAVVNAGAKDRRSILAEQLEAHVGGRI